MNELDKILDLIVSQKGGTKRDYKILMDMIGYLESHNIADRKQMGGGPGRGLYQYEMGPNKSGIIAAKRAVNFMRKNNYKVPKWVRGIAGKKDLDVSTLDKDKQSVLFLMDKMERRGADFSKVWEGEKSLEDFYLDSHWAGNITDRASKRNYFRSAVKEFNNDRGVESTFDSPIKMHGDYQIPSYIDKPTSPRENLIKEYSPQNLSVKNYKDNQLEYGGSATAGGYERQGNLSTYDAGGSHSQNPLGGIPLNMGDNGRVNSVEENESSIQTNDGRYVFSDKLSL